MSTNDPSTPERSDFIRDIVADDLRSGRHASIVTRFPPEPNGHLHIGHAKSICLNFGIAQEFGGRCHLRFDDTNPTKEEQEYIDAIEADVRWLGFDWGEHLYYASDYFEQLYRGPCTSSEAGLAYVDDLSAEEIRAHRGTLTEPGTDSPWRDRSSRRTSICSSACAPASSRTAHRVLRARIDMASPNSTCVTRCSTASSMPAHPRTGDDWCIYPTYDFAHGQSDAIEGITHSICTLEFENHRPLYDWFIEHLPVPSSTAPVRVRPPQPDLDGALQALPAASRARTAACAAGTTRACPPSPACGGGAIPAEGIREFATEVGVSKRDAVVEMEQLEHVVRDVLNRRALRRFAVLRPLKVVIEDYPEGAGRGAGRRQQPGGPAGRDAPRALLPGALDRARRLHGGSAGRSSSGWRRAARCACGMPTSSPAARSSRTPPGEVVELRCTHDPATRGGDAPDGRRPKATLHWVSATHAVPAEVRLYDRLFVRPDPGADGDLLADLNPDSEEILADCWLEPAAADLAVGQTVQFERLGYFSPDPDSRPADPSSTARSRSRTAGPRHRRRAGPAADGRPTRRPAAVRRAGCREAAPDDSIVGAMGAPDRVNRTGCCERLPSGRERVALPATERRSRCVDRVPGPARAGSPGRRRR